MLNISHNPADTSNCFTGSLYNKKSPDMLNTTVIYIHGILRLRLMHLVQNAYTYLLRNLLTRYVGRYDGDN